MKFFEILHQRHAAHHRFFCRFSCQCASDVSWTEVHDAIWRRVHVKTALWKSPSSLWKSHATDCNRRSRNSHSWKGKSQCFEDVPRWLVVGRFCFFPFASMKQTGPDGAHSHRHLNIFMCIYIYYIYIIYIYWILCIHWGSFAAKPKIASFLAPKTTGHYCCYAAPRVQTPRPNSTCKCPIKKVHKLRQLSGNRVIHSSLRW